MPILKFRTIILEPEIQFLQMQSKAVLCWIGFDFVSSYESAVKDERVCDGEVC